MKNFTLFFIITFLFAEQTIAQNINQSVDARLTGQGSNTANFFQSNLMDRYDIHFLKLELNITPNLRFLSGSCFYKMTATQAIDTFAI